jgi:peptidoglycan hydrolase-like protein with peptidoglycan-binding domain
MLAVSVYSAHAAGRQTATKKSSTSSKSSSRSSHSKKSKYAKRQKGQQAPAPERISEIQEALAKDGSFASSPTGKWDDATTDAMKRFQASHGLNATGKLDAPTLQKLGLGSKTAGVAAPQPSARSSLLTAPGGTLHK